MVSQNSQNSQNLEGKILNYVCPKYHDGAISAENISLKPHLR